MIAFLWKYMLNPQPDAGLNAMLGFLGLDFLQQNWLGDPGVALWAVGLTVVWQFAGFSMVIFLAALQGIPRELEEAAAIDGAGRFQRFHRIVLPLIAPAMTINLTLSTIGGLKLFDQVFAITTAARATRPRRCRRSSTSRRSSSALWLLDRRRARAHAPGRRAGAAAGALPAEPRGDVLMLTRYRPRTFALELLMIFVALLFAYPVYVLVNLSLKNPHEIARGEHRPALAPRDLQLLERLERRAPRRRDDELDDHHGDQPGLPDHDRLDRRVLPRPHPVEAELRHVPAVPARASCCRSSSRSCRCIGS